MKAFTSKTGSSLPIWQYGCAVAALILCPFTVGHAQNASAPASADTLALDPFRVQGRPNEGYAAYNTVSGTGMNMPLKDIPISINVITSEFLKDSLVGPTIEAFDYNTSITQFARTGVISKLANVTIRGFAARYILLDGVEAGNFISPDLIDRMEVVKGPNTLYGQSDPGGLINVISKRPLPNDAVTVSAFAGNRGRLGGSLDANMRSDNKRLGLRLLARHDESDGFRRVDGSTSNFAGLIGDYRINKTTNVDFYVTREEIRSVPSERVAFPFEERPTDLNGDGAITNTVVGGVNERSSKYNNNFLPWDWTALTPANHSRQSNSFMSARLVKQLTDNIDIQYRYGRTEGTFKLLSREYDAFVAAGTSNTDIRAEDYSAVDEVHTLNLSARFTLAGMEHSLLVGGRVAQADALRVSRRFFLADGPDAGQTQTPWQQITSLYQQRLGNPSFQFRTQLTKDQALTQNITLDPIPTYEETMAYGKRFSTAGLATEKIRTYYLTDSVALLDKRLHLLAGVRRVNIQSLGYDYLGNLVGAPNDQTNTSYQGGLTYALTGNLSAYGSYATAFIPNARNPDTNTYFAPGKSFAGEVGVKFTDLFGGKISGSLAGYSIKRTNVTNQDFNPNTGFFVSELSDQESKGIDFETYFNLKPGWSGMLGYSYTDAKVVKSVTSSKGLRLEGAAPHRVSLWASYAFSGDWDGWRVGGGMVYVKGPVQQFGTSTNRYVYENGYTTFDFFTRYTTKVYGRPITLGVNIDNLNNVMYWRTRGTLSTPRQVMVSVEAPF